MGDDKWHAGVVLLADLFRAVRDTYGAKVGLCLLKFGGQHSVPHDLAEQADEIIAYPDLTRWTPSWVMDRLTTRVLSWDLTGERLLKRHRVNAVAFGSLRARARVPVVGWLPDFRHVHMPEMFSAQERRNRDQTFMRTARDSDLISLLSETVRRDFEAFAPRYARKARVLRPIAHVPPGAYDTDLGAVLKQYGLPEKFVYLPNQFWTHKNHESVFRALKILGERGTKVFLVCSGYAGDPLCSGHFEGLLQKMSVWGVRAQVAILGLVPRDVVFALMRQGVCVLNPSLFEGYGLSVEEARSVGTRLLVSDIPAHREHNPPQATFFDPLDCEALAAELGAMWEGTQPGPDAELESAARQEQPQRARLYAEAFVSVVQEVVRG